MTSHVLKYSIHLLYFFLLGAATVVWYVLSGSTNQNKYNECATTDTWLVVCISGLASSQEIFRGRLKFEQPCLFAVHSIKGHAYIFTLGSSWTEQSSFIHDTVLGQSDPRGNRCQTSGKTISPSPVKTQGVVQSNKGHSFIFTLGSSWTVQARPHIKIVTCMAPIKDNKVYYYYY